MHGINVLILNIDGYFMKIKVLFYTLPKNSLTFLISIILTIIGIISSIVIYYKGRERKSISYNVVDNHLISNFKQKINGLTIQYSGKDIERLSVTNFIFWNNGTETIHRDNIPHKDKFSITIKDGNYILDKSIINVTNKANKIDPILSNDKKKIDIDFEYLDKGNGFILKIFHTGEKYNDFDVNGSIMGFGKISKGFTKKERNSLIKTMYTLFMIAPFIIFLIRYAINNFRDNILLSIISVFISLSYIIFFVKSPFRDILPY
jgi:hypothetical protein